MRRNVISWARLATARQGRLSVRGCLGPWAGAACQGQGVARWPTRKAHARLSPPGPQYARRRGGAEPPRGPPPEPPGAGARRGSRSAQREARAAKAGPHDSATRRPSPPLATPHGAHGRGRGGAPLLRITTRNYPAKQPWRPAGPTTFWRGRATIGGALQQSAPALSSLAPSMGPLRICRAPNHAHNLKVSQWGSRGAVGRAGVAAGQGERDGGRLPGPQCAA